MLSINDWKRAHSLSTAAAADIIAANGVNSLPHSTFFGEEAGIYGGDQHVAINGALGYNLQAYVVPALSNLFGASGKVTELVAQIEFADLSPR